MLDVNIVFNDIVEKRADITWAVLQFPDDAKLKKLQEDSDLAAFLHSMDGTEPYEIRELPAVGGKKQYIVMSKTNKLPFMEDGLTQKQGEDEMARAMAREQLAIYAQEYPWTAPLIKAGLERARHANCHSCAEKRLVQEIALAVREHEGNNIPDLSRAMPLPPSDDFEDYAGGPSEDPGIWGAREPCPMCTLKHLGQAIVLLNESLLGYPTHRWIAIGHMAEAEAEAPDPDLANRIRAQRIAAMDDLDYIPTFTDIIVELDAIVRG